MIGILLLLACQKPVPAGPDACAEASERYGAQVCVHEIPDLAAWEDVTVDALAVDQVREGKYLMPASDEAVVPTLFVDVGTIELHYDLMTQAFPDQFPGLSFDEYVASVIDPDERVYWAGNLAEYIDPAGGTWFGFTVWDDPARDDATVTYEQVLSVYEELLPRFGPTPLVFVPNSSNQRAVVDSWDAGFPIRGADSNLAYEAYTQGVGYGTVRLFTLEELAAAEATGDFGFQDLLILDEAPFDVERVIAGAVTGTRQGTLSHLNVRSAARGTPNCYVADPLRNLAAWEGQLVRLECGAVSWRVDAATPEEAQAFWDALRPEPLDIPEPDLATVDLVGLLDLPTTTEADRDLGMRRYGAKGTNLATLYQRIPAELQLKGFVVPFAFYDALMRGTPSGDLPVPRGYPRTLAGAIAAWHDDPAFLTDAAERHRRLARLRDAIEDAEPDPVLVHELVARIVELYGNDTTMVRFRSSSNAEDALGFTGAGLYDSTSACPADEADGDDVGPSRCDPDQDEERTVSRALGEVWASLWNARAWEEREWYGIDHRKAVMGVLVDTRIGGEAANVVAFTGNPSADDDRFLVNAQVGAYDVVSAEPGVYPEQILLDIQGGQVAGIERIATSSEADEVLTDAQLRTLGASLANIEAVFPVDGEVPADRTLMLDTEWKLLDDGTWIVKQARPFLR